MIIKPLLPEGGDNGVLRMQHPYGKTATQRLHPHPYIYEKWIAAYDC